MRFPVSSFVLSYLGIHMLPPRFEFKMARSLAVLYICILWFQVKSLVLNPVYRHISMQYNLESLLLSLKLGLSVLKFILSETPILILLTL